MIYTLFFSRLRHMGPAAREDYDKRSVDLEELAHREHPGFLGMKTYVAEDGERLTVVRFEDEAAQRGWKLDPEHRVAQDKGRTDFYDQYRIAVLELQRMHEWEREPNGSDAGRSDAETTLSKGGAV